MKTKFITLDVLFELEVAVVDGQDEVYHAVCHVRPWPGTLNGERLAPFRSESELAQYVMRYAKAYVTENK